MLTVHMRLMTFILTQYVPVSPQGLPGSNQKLVKDFCGRVVAFLVGYLGGVVRCISVALDISSKVIRRPSWNSFSAMSSFNRNLIIRGHLLKQDNNYTEIQI